MLKCMLIFIAACFYYSGLVKLARWWRERRERSLVVLNYHRATGGNLRRHLLYLRRHYRILHLEAALEELYTLRKEEKPYRRDRRTLLALTFDDGYSDNYSYGFAQAHALQVPFTIFLIPGYFESGDYFWWLEGRRLVRRAQVSEATIEGHTYHLNKTDERNALARAIDTGLRHATSIAEREAFLMSVRNVLVVPSSIVPEEEPTLPLKWSEVREMEKSGWVSFGGHTMNHPILAYLTDPVEMQREIGECRTMLEQQLGHLIRTFAYPVGQLQHIKGNVPQTVQQAGYDWAFTTMYGFNTAQSNRYLLRRVEVDVSQHWLVMAAATAGLWGFFSRLRWIPTVRNYLMNSHH